MSRLTGGIKKYPSYQTEKHFSKGLALHPKILYNISTRERSEDLYMLKNPNAEHAWSIIDSLYTEDSVYISVVKYKIIGTIEQDGQTLYRLFNEKMNWERSAKLPVEELFDTREEAYTEAVKRATTICP